MKLEFEKKEETIDELREKSYNKMFQSFQKISEMDFLETEKIIKIFKKENRTEKEEEILNEYNLFEMSLISVFYHSIKRGNFEEVEIIMKFFMNKTD